MRCLPRAIWRLACLICLFLSALSAQAAERVTVTGDLRDGLAHIEFEWPKAVSYDARVILERLIVRFSEPGDFELSTLDEGLYELFAKPKVVADGFIVAFPLRAPVAVRHSQEGRRIIVELLDERSQEVVATAAGQEGAEPSAVPSVQPATSAVDPSASQLAQNKDSDPPDLLTPSTTIPAPCFAIS